MFDARKCLRAVQRIPIIDLTIKGRERHAANKISNLHISQLVSIKGRPKGGFVTVL
jgi:hypothetical protein